MRIVTLTDSDYGFILRALETYDPSLANVFQASVRFQERVTNFPYFTQGGIVTNSREHSPHHVSPLPPTVKQLPLPPLPPVIKASPANRDMWGHAP